MCFVCVYATFFFGLNERMNYLSNLLKICYVKKEEIQIDLLQFQTHSISHISLIQLILLITNKKLAYGISG